jgi:hypothetical protein
MMGDLDDGVNFFRGVIIGGGFALACWILIALVLA